MSPVAVLTPCELKASWGRLCYYDSGANGDVAYVFLHGTGCAGLDFAPIVACWPAAMQGAVRVLALDFRGHGASEVPVVPFSIADLARDVAWFIAALNLRRVVLVGHSLGGMVALAVAAHCAAVCGLILLEGWTNLRASGAFAEGHMFGDLPPEHVEAIKARGAATRARFAPENWEAFWQTVRDFDATAIKASLAIPIAEVYGTWGRHAATAALLQVPERPNITWHWIEGAGHFLPQECANEITAICHDVRLTSD